MKTPSNAPLVWVDLEMTGLDPERHVIIEVASVVTDAHLNVVAEGPVLAVRRTDEELARIDEWSLGTHTASGLLQRVRESTVDIAEAERLTLEFVRAHVKEKQSPLCGNSVHQDRLFIAREMPAFDAHLHYRIVDVSSLKELVRRWYPRASQAPAKRRTHLALDDIRESIEELRWYRQHVFAAPPTG